MGFVLFNGMYKSPNTPSWSFYLLLFHLFLVNKDRGADEIQIQCEYEHASFKRSAIARRNALTIEGRV